MNPANTINYSQLKRNRLAMQHHDFYDTSKTGRERILRAYYHEEAATSGDYYTAPTDTQISIYKVMFQGRNIVRLLRQETIESMEQEIKEGVEA